MQKLIWPVLVSFLICLAIGPMLIKGLRRLNFGQSIKELGPQWHISKAGTPTMGGILIMAAFVITTLLFAPYYNADVLVGIGFILLIALVGFLDDFIGIRKKNNDGLSPRGKMILLVLVSLAASVYGYVHIGTSIRLPFTTATWDLGFWYIPFTTFVLVAMENGANLTDGLDGLNAGIGLVCFAAFALIFNFMGDVPGRDAYVVMAASLAGASLGFIRFNTFPARLFMGDTGSLPIGAAVGWLAVISGMHLWLPVMCFMYVASSLSVIIQVAHYKRTKKRVFLMAPIHHHFEKKGFPETRITSMYMIITVVLCLLGIAAVQF